MKTISSLWTAPRCAVVVSWVLLAFLTGCSKAPDNVSGFYPGHLNIEKAKNLTPEEREVEKRFADDLEKNTEEKIVEYHKAFGNTINADNVRELSKDYAPGSIDNKDAATKIARTKWSAAVHEPSSALTKEIYKRELQKSPGQDERNLVVFMGGGAASGKTNSTKNLTQLKSTLAAAQIIYDATLASLKSSNEKISQALDKGKEVSIIYVYRDPIDSFVSAMQRSTGTGRTLPIDAFIDTHLGAQECILNLYNLYGKDKRVEMQVIDNSKDENNVQVRDVEFMQTIHRYLREDLKKQLQEKLESAHDKREITDLIYQAFKGSPSSYSPDP